jgi:hypothetical protein
MSLILNFHTEISIIEGNPQTLPQIRIDDVEATSCLNVTAIILSQSARLIIQIRDMCSVYCSRYMSCAFLGNNKLFFAHRGPLDNVTS